jgi:hypothetical protein
MSHGKVSIFSMLAILFLLLSAVSATPIAISSSTIARLQARDCPAQAPGTCTFSLPFDSQGPYVYIGDSACYPIGGTRVNGDFDVASQLKYKVDGNVSLNPNPSFCYAGECHGPNDPCWSFQQGNWALGGDAYTQYSCQFTCSQG